MKENNGKFIVILDKFNCQSFPLNEKAIWVSNEDLEQIEKTKCFDVKNNCVIDYDNSEKEKVKKIEELRSKRAHECFSVINRGALWYKKLNDEQIEELEKWYNDWLNVTDTFIIPIKPYWIDGGK